MAEHLKDTDEPMEEPPNVPFIPHQFNRQLYDQWEEIRQSNRQTQENYSPFGEIEGRTDDRQIQGPANWEDIWPPDSTYIGEEWKEHLPPEIPLTDNQKSRCFSDLIKNVEFMENIGKGVFGRVWMVMADYRCGDLYPWKRLPFACKVILHRSDDLQGIELSLNEMRILRYLRHENICNMAETIGIYDSQTNFPYSIVCVFLEICDGNFRHMYMQCVPQDFFSWAEKYPLDERLSRHWFAQVIRGLDYIHQNQVIHLDIKAENILFKYRPNESRDTYEDRFLSATFKLADFGCSRVETNPVNIKRYQKQDLKLIYDMLLEYGVGGIRGGLREESMLIIYCKNGFWKDMYPPQWQSLSEDFRSLISKLSDSRPTVPKMLTASELLSNSWLQNNDERRTEPFIDRPGDHPFFPINFNPQLYSEWEEQRNDPSLHQYYAPFGYAPISGHRIFDNRKFEWKVQYRPISGAVSRWNLHNLEPDTEPPDLDEFDAPQR